MESPVWADVGHHAADAAALTLADAEGARLRRDYRPRSRLLGGTWHEERMVWSAVKHAGTLACNHLFIDIPSLLISQGDATSQESN